MSDSESLPLLLFSLPFPFPLPLPFLFLPGVPPEVVEAPLSEPDDDEEEDAEEPYEKIRVRVTFPILSEYSNQLELERWIPWDQVYGEEEDELSREGDI